MLKRLVNFKEIANNITEKELEYATLSLSFVAKLVLIKHLKERPSNFKKNSIKDHFETTYLTNNYS